MKYLEFFCTGGWPLFPSIYLYTHTCMYICISLDSWIFILWVIIQHHFIVLLKLLQLWLLELFSCSKLSMVPRQSPKMDLRKKLISPGGECFWPRRALLTGSSLVASRGLSPGLGGSVSSLRCPLSFTQERLHRGGFRIGHQLHGKAVLLPASGRAHL